MKTFYSFLTFTFVLLLTNIVNAQWANPGISNHSGSDPRISGGSPDLEFNCTNTSGYSGLQFLTQGLSDGYIVFDHAANEFRFTDGGQTSSSSLFSIDIDGQGVGTSTNGFINIGPISGTHLTTDGNEIQCKTSTGDNTSLFLNYWGGTTYVASGNGAGDLSVGIGSDLFVDNSEGRIGINNSSPQDELHIKGTSTTADIRIEASGSKYLRFYEGTTQKGYIGHSGTNISLYNGETNGSLTMSTPNYINFATNSSTRMRIINNGDIGMGTASPLSDLHIQDNGQVAGIIVERVDANNYVNLLSGSNGNSFFFAQGQRFSISPSSSITSTTPNNNNSVFVYGPNWSVAAQRGKMGVGRLSPVEKLDVNGRVRATGYVTASDKRLKDNIKDLEYGLEVVKNLRPVSFSYNGKSDIDDKSVHYGLIAQELKELAPEFVEEYTHVIYELGEGDSQVAIGEEKYLQIKDSELKFIVINAVKDLAKENDELKDQVAQLTNRLERIEALLASEEGQDIIDQSKATIIGSTKEAVLAQNRPNPFEEQTTIDYFIPEGSKNAQMNIFDMNGKVIKQIPLEGTGAGQLDLNVSNVASGNYMYQLITDGKIVETKTMTIVK